MVYEVLKRGLIDYGPHSLVNLLSQIQYHYNLLQNSFPPPSPLFSLVNYFFLSSPIFRFFTLIWNGFIMMCIPEGDRLDLSSFLNSLLQLKAISDEKLKKSMSFSPPSSPFGRLFNNSKSNNKQ